ncbi:hypothetical protein [uncultured Chitinophaga sp.]|uniref:hypothetical protein n=1 Tax=uncultured Chitinophaga sp. TaxID=339340 RepID=UPI0025EDE357|nr:hypothetical protein [uncultured Chitinophaga sp.]
MAVNYSKRLQNVQNRKFDRGLNESLTSQSFAKRDLPENMKYLLEAMRPIGKKYNDRTIAAAEAVQNHLENGYNLHFLRTYRRQGSVETNTNIEAHSDIDLLTIIGRYHFLAPGIPNNDPYTYSEPQDDIKLLRTQSNLILSRQYDEIDNSGEKCLSIFNKHYQRKVDVVFAFWYSTPEYISLLDERRRGILIGSRHAKADYPFAHIDAVNNKGNHTFDGSKMAIRLLKTLKADADTDWDLLKSFQLTTIVHSMNNNSLLFLHSNQIQIASAISEHLSRIIDDRDFRRGIWSPNSSELPLLDEKIVPQLVMLKRDLDELIIDTSNELRNSFFIKQAMQSY